MGAGPICIRLPLHANTNAGCAKFHSLPRGTHHGRACRNSSSSFHRKSFAPATVSGRAALKSLHLSLFCKRRRCRVCFELLQLNLLNSISGQRRCAGTANNTTSVSDFCKLFHRIAAARQHGRWWWLIMVKGNGGVYHVGDNFILTPLEGFSSTPSFLSCAIFTLIGDVGKKQT